MHMLSHFFDENLDGSYSKSHKNFSIGNLNCIRYPLQTGRFFFFSLVVKKRSTGTLSKR